MDYPLQPLYSPVVPDKCVCVCDVCALCGCVHMCCIISKLDAIMNFATSKYTHTHADSLIRFFSLVAVWSCILIRLAMTMRCFAFGDSLIHDYTIYTYIVCNCVMLTMVRSLFRKLDCVRLFPFLNRTTQQFTSSTRSQLTKIALWTNNANTILQRIRMNWNREDLRKIYSIELAEYVCVCVCVCT